MASTTPTQDMQTRHKAQEAYAQEHPEWMALAMQVINDWGREAKTLPHAIAAALQDAYERTTPPAMPVSEARGGTVRRQRPAPQHAPKIVRRTR